MYFLFILIQLLANETAPRLPVPPPPRGGQQVIPLRELPNRAGDTVAVAGRVSLGTGVFGPERLRVYLQDGSGAAVLTGGSIPLVLVVGDSIEATGVAAASSPGAGQLKVLGLAKIGTSKRFPPAVSVPLSNAALEAHRGQLVRVTGRIVSTKRENGDDLLIVTDFADPTARVIVEAEEDITSFAGFARFGIGDVVSASGVLTRRFGNHHGPEGYVLYIRDGNDARAVGLPLRTRRFLLMTTAAAILLIGAALATARVITRRTQRRLAKAKAQLHATYEVASDAILVLDEQWNIVDANAAASALFGRGPDAIVGRAALPLFHPDSVAQQASTANTLLASSSADRRTRVLGAGGKLISVDLRLTSIEVFGQQRIVAVLRDVSDRVRAEAELRGVFAAMSDVVLVLSRDGEYLRIPSTSTCRLYRPAGDLLGRNIRDVLPAADAEAVCGVIQQALDSRQRVAYEYSLPFPDGDVWFSASVTRLDDISVVWVARDVTPERKAAQALRDSEEQLRQSQKIEAVGMLAGGIAHDFNNILTAIRAHSEFLLEGLAANDSRYEDASGILKAAERAAALTRQLLAFSRKQILKPAVLDLNFIVSNLRTMLGRLIGEDIEIVTSLDAGLGAVVADASQIEQVLVNLAVNSRDAMPAGGTLRLETSNLDVREGSGAEHGAVPPGHYVRIAVTDTGCGMSAETRSRLFQPFFTTKEQGRGTGLGLPTVYGIVKQSNGFISVSSEPGHGTTFEILLPRTADSPRSHAAQQRPESSPRGSETILLVEDEPVVRQLARRMLQRQGYVIVEAVNGSHALTLAAAFDGRIDLVLTDAVMPELGGSELVRRIRESRPNVKVLLMSGYTEDEIMRRQIASDTGAFLEKPFTVHSLSSAVRRVLDKLPAATRISEVGQRRSGSRLRISGARTVHHLLNERSAGASH